MGGRGRVPSHARGLGAGAPHRWCPRARQPLSYQRLAMGGGRQALRAPEQAASCAPRVCAGARHGGRPFGPNGVSEGALRCRATAGGALTLRRVAASRTGRQSWRSAAVQRWARAADTTAEPTDSSGAGRAARARSIPEGVAFSGQRAWAWGRTVTPEGPAWRGDVRQPAPQLFAIVRGVYSALDLFDNRPQLDFVGPFSKAPAGPVDLAWWLKRLPGSSSKLTTTTLGFVGWPEPPAGIGGSKRVDRGADI